MRSAQNGAESEQKVNAPEGLFRVPKDRLLRITDVERMLGMPVFADPQRIERFARLPQKGFGLWAARQVRPVRAPGRNDLIGPASTFKDGGVIPGAHRISRLAHLEGIRITPCENIGNLKSAKTQRPRPPLTPLYGWIVLNFCGL